MTGPGAPAGPPGAARRAWPGAAAALVAAWALLFAPALLGDGQFLYRDAGRMHYPVKRWIAGELRRGHLPEWNPLAGLGTPVVAGSVDAPQHPLNLLLLALPFDAAFKAWVLLSVLAAGLGAFAWARTLGRSPAAAAVAGAAFMLSGFVVASTDNPTYLTTLAAGPWLLAAGRTFARRGGPGPLALVAAASGLCAAGGDPQGWSVALALTVVQSALPLDGTPGLTRARRALALGAAAVVAAAPFVLPVALWIPGSSRADPYDAQEVLRWNLHPSRLAELLVPHLFRGPFGPNPVFEAYAGSGVDATPWVLSVYLGAASLVLAGLGVARDRGARVVLAVAVLLAWMAMGRNAGFGQVAELVPVLSRFRYWEKLVGWISLLLAVAAAAGADRLLSPAAPAEARRLWPAAAALGGALLAASAAARLVTASPAPRTAALQGLLDNLGEGALAAGLAVSLLAVVALLLARRHLARAAAPLLVGLVALDLVAANVRAYVLSDPATCPPRPPLAEALAAGPGPHRVVTPFSFRVDRWPELHPFESTWGWASRTVAAAWNVGAGVGNLDAYTGMAPRRLIRFRLALDTAGAARQARLFGFCAVVVPGAPANARLAGLDPPFRVLAEEPALPAYLLPMACRPRAYLAGEVATVDEAAALAFARTADPASPLTVVEGLAPAPGPAVGTATIERDEPERVAVRVEADRRALLVLDDAFADGWTAEVDGVAAPIHPANYLARGVVVEAGSHLVSFRYRTPGLREGWLAAGLLAALLATWALAARRAIRTE